MAEKLMTMQELAKDLHASYQAVQARLKLMGAEAVGRDGEGRKLFRVDPEKVRSKRDLLHMAGFQPSSWFAERLRVSQYNAINFLSHIRAECRQGWRKSLFWRLPKELEDFESFRKAYGDYVREKEEWAAKMRGEEDEKDWLATVPEGPVKDMVAEERRLKSMVGKEVEAEFGLRRIRGTLLQGSMNSFTLRVGRDERFFLSREARIVATI